MIELENFPTTRYQGSKRKILDWLHENFKDIPFDTVLDGFGGTGSVSYLFKKMGKTVTYNDHLKFNHIIGTAIIENSSVNLSIDDINFILGEHIKENGFISDNFANYYYTDEENFWLDNIVKGINELKADTSEETRYKKAIAFYALFQACLRKRPFNLFHRKNLYLRLNDVKRNFGNKTTWEKDFSNEFIYFANEANRLVFDSNKVCNSLNKSIFEIGGGGFDLVYLDPPYIISKGSNESSNYRHCYHFLEGISNYDDWGNLVDYKSTNLRLKSEDNCFDSSRIYMSIEKIISTHQDSIIALSYKIGGIPSLEELEDLVKKYKKDVTVITKHYKYALNRQNGNAALNREVLIIGK